MSIFNFCASLFAIVTLFYFYAKYKLSYWSRRGVESLPAHFICGNFKDVFLQRASVGEVVARLHSEAKKDLPFLGIYIMLKPFLLVRDPEIIKHILIKDFEVFSSHYFTCDREKDVISNTNLFTVRNPRWKYIRKKLSPAFSSGKQKKLFELTLASADNMKNHFEDLFQDETVTIDAKEITTRYTTDVVASLTFGVETNSFSASKSDFYEHTRSVWELGPLRCVQIFGTFFFPKLGDLLQGTMLGRATSYFRKIFWEAMDHREKKNFRRGDVIDYLLDIKNDEQAKEYDIEGDVLVAQSAIFLLAGVETSAITIAMALHELAKNPSVQKKLRSEIREKLDGREMTYEAVQEMKYLQQVVMETLRIYPPLPLLDRVAESDYQIPGTKIVIEKGTGVQIALTGLHNDPRFFEEPEKFDPDRFSDEKKDEMKQCSYMPFGDGLRVCIGTRLGTLQTAVGLVTLLRNHEVALNPKYKNELSKRAIIIQPANGIF